MSDDDWDQPIALQSKPAVRHDDDDDVVLVDSVESAETSKPKKPVDAKTELMRATAQSKQKQKEREAELAREAERARLARPMTAEEKAAEALRLRKLVEDTDSQLAGDLFGGGSSVLPGVSAAKALDGVIQDVDSLKAVLHRVQLSTNKETEDLAKAIGQRLEMGVSRPLTVSFLKSLLRAACQGLTDDDVNDVSGVLNVIKNEKVKAKLAKKKPSTTVKPKGNLNTGGDSKFDLDGTLGQRAGAGAFDDDDFM